MLKTTLQCYVAVPCWLLTVRVTQVSPGRARARSLRGARSRMGRNSDWDWGGTEAVTNQIAGEQSYWKLCR